MKERPFHKPNDEIRALIAELCKTETNLNKIGAAVGLTRFVIKRHYRDVLETNPKIKKKLDKGPAYWVVPKPSRKGWGGPAEGHPPGMRPPAPFQPGHQPIARRKVEEEKIPQDPESVAWRDEKRKKAMMLYAETMEGEEFERGLRLVAADKLLDRMDGKPVGREITTNAATLEELVAASMRPKIIDGTKE